jgi:hypothetical protein
MLVRDRARMVDLVLRRAWSLHAGAGEREVALVAVGGYGRGELHPCSDIDVMILLPKSGVTAVTTASSGFSPSSGTSGSRWATASGPLTTVSAKAPRMSASRPR